MLGRIMVMVDGDKALGRVMVMMYGDKTLGRIMVMTEKSDGIFSYLH